MLGGLGGLRTAQKAPHFDMVSLWGPLVPGARSPSSSAFVGRPERRLTRFESVQRGTVLMIPNVILNGPQAHFGPRNSALQKSLISADLNLAKSC
jgi:hypothetical protein